MRRDVFVPFAGLALVAHAAAGFALLGRHFVLAGICVVVAPKLRAWRFAAR